MRLFEIPTRRMPVRVILGPGDELAGELFAPQNGPGGAPTTLDQRLNDETESFLALSTGNANVLIHRKQIVAVHSETPRGDDGVPQLDGGSHVEVDLAGERRLTGRLVYSMPAGRARLIDYLNAAPRFIALYHADGTTWFNRDKVIRVRAVAATRE